MNKIFIVTPKLSEVHIITTKHFYLKKNLWTLDFPSTFRTPDIL